MIKALSEDLRNKISAGEVVENPASVIKELVENSLDAGANDINIIVEKGGHQTIQVRDNGFGISSEDLPASIMRFHTSKITSLTDLFSINTLGFRGEALASIASVSEMKIISSMGENEGASLLIIDGQSGDLEPAPKINGTEITIRNLFYNTPVRKKFLKTPRTELRKIVDVVRRYGLSYPEVAFKLIADERQVFNLSGDPYYEAYNSSWGLDISIFVGIILGSGKFNSFFVVLTQNFFSGSPPNGNKNLNCVFLSSGLFGTGVPVKISFLTKGRVEISFAAFDLSAPSVFIL